MHGGSVTPNAICLVGWISPAGFFGCILTERMLGPAELFVRKEQLSYAAVITIHVTPA